MYGLVQNTAALMTVQGTVAVLKLLGTRYLGYIGLALAIWDFMDCIKPGDETPIANTNGLYALDLDSYLLPTPLPTNIIYTNIASNITSGASYTTTSPIFFNAMDQKYYSNSNFTDFVPNGFYNGAIVGAVQQYHLIVDGVATMAYIVE